MYIIFFVTTNYIFDGNCSADQLLDQLLHGHLESPEYNISCYDKHSFPKGSLFLTVCIHETDSGRIEKRERESESNQPHYLRQLYRVDAPLKIRKDLRAERITSNLLNQLGVSHPNPQILERIIDNYRLASFYIDNPYILMPRCPPNCSITLTLSQVVSWPRAFAIGQTSEDLKRMLFLHRVSAWNQGLNSCNWTNLPEPDEGRRLMITLPDTNSTESGGSRVNLSHHSIETTSDLSYQSTTSSTTSSPSRSKNRTNKISTLPAISLTTSHTPSCQISSPKIFKKQTVSSPSNTNPFMTDNTTVIYGGVLTWSLLSMTSESMNEGGYLISVPRGSGDRNNLASRREVWCVLIDKFFFTYPPINSVKPRTHANLKHCYVTPMADGIFRIDNEELATSSTSPSFKTLFFIGRNRKEGASWFWKLYTQSASNSVQRYSTLNFLPGGIAASFSIVQNEGDEAIFNPKSIREDVDHTMRKIRAPGHRVNSHLASLRADPMLAFVFKEDDTDSYKILGMSEDLCDQEHVRKFTIEEMVKSTKLKNADVVGRSNSLAGKKNKEGDVQDNNFWAGSDLSVAIATAVDTVNRAHHSTLNDSNSIEIMKSEETMKTLVSSNKQSHYMKSYTPQSNCNSPSKPSKGALAFLFKGDVEMKKLNAKQIIISLQDIGVRTRSGLGSKSRLARFKSRFYYP